MHFVAFYLLRLSSSGLTSYDGSFFSSVHQPSTNWQSQVWSCFVCFSAFRFHKLNDEVYRYECIDFSFSLLPEYTRLLRTSRSLEAVMLLFWPWNLNMWLTCCKKCHLLFMRTISLFPLQRVSNWRTSRRWVEMHTQTMLMYLKERINRR